MKIFALQWKNESNYDHQKRKHLPHRDEPKNIADLYIGSSEKFSHNAKQSVPTKKPYADLTRILNIFLPPEKNEEQYNSLEKCLHKWRREIGYTIHHTGKKTFISRHSEEFPIYIISDPPEKYTNRHYPYESISELQKMSFYLPCCYKPSNDHSDSSPMKRHTPSPGHQYF